MDQSGVNGPLKSGAEAARAARNLYLSNHQRCLGSLAEEIVLAGKFFVPKEQRIADSGQEQLLLHATVEELVRHDLALRENADDGCYLVFPSQFNRDYEDAPEPKGKAVAITFDGPVQSLYSTLAVRLGYSGLFTTGRSEMWRNAAVFTARAGGKCGLFLHEFAAGGTAEYAKYAEAELREQRRLSSPLSELLRQPVLLSRGSLAAHKAASPAGENRRW